MTKKLNFSSVFTHSVLYSFGSRYFKSSIAGVFLIFSRRQRWRRLWSAYPMSMSSSLTSESSSSTCEVERIPRRGATSSFQPCDVHETARLRYVGLVDDRPTLGTNSLPATADSIRRWSTYTCAHNSVNKLLHGRQSRHYMFSNSPDSFM